MKRKLQLKVNSLLFAKIFILGTYLLCNIPQTFANQSLGNNRLILTQINETKISINVQNATIKTILYEINKQTKINFIYKDEELKSLPTRTINKKDVTVKQLLDILLKDTDFTYSFIDNNIAITKKTPKVSTTKNTKQDQIVVNGKLLDTEKKPIIGATIQIVGTYNGAISDENGDFSLNITPGAEIEVSYTGKLPVLKRLNNADEHLVIVMQDDAVAMDDVVVNGYFNKAKTSYTGAAKSFDKEELRKVSNQNILSTLSMIDPSFKIVENNLMGSNPNAVPSFTIRGGADFQGMVNDTRGTRNMPLFVLDGFVVPAQQIYDLDPNRVENITLLKDAAATAIYGSRASNGVVIVETVKLEKGKIRLTYTGDLNLEMPDITCYNVLNSQDKLKYEVIAGIYKEIGLPWYDESRRHLYNSRKKLVEQGYNTDWLNKPINSIGVGHKHSALVEGGDDNFTYGLMLNYEDKKGVMKKSNRERLGINMKFQYRYKNIKLKNDLGFQRVIGNNSPYGSYSTYVGMNPYYPYLDDKGNYKKVLAYKVDAFGAETTEPIVNPLYNGTLFAIDRNITDRLINNFQIEWDIVESLKFKTQFSISKDWNTDDEYKSDKHTDFEYYPSEDIFRKGQYRKGNGSAISYSFNAVMSYNKNFGDNFISLNAGLDIIQDKNEYLSYTVEGVADIAVTPSMALQYLPGSTPMGSDGIKRSIGVFGNASYSWKNKYLVDFSYRTDASSVYGKNSRWGAFWSAGIGWNMHRENFLKDSKTINYLKLRASTGIVGGDNFEEFQSLKTYRFMNSMRYENWQGVQVIGIDNPNLKWQRKLKTNVGTEFELFGNKLKGSLDYYWETSSDNMTDVALPPSLGFASYKDNLGKVMNRGVELSLNYRYLDKKDFQSTLFVNLINNVNKVKEISESLVAFNKLQDQNVSNKPLVRYIEGESQNTIWTVPSLGIDPATGDELFRSRSGKATRIWSPEDYLPMGCKDPKLEGTFGNTLSYKGLQLNIFFSYRLGADVYNETLVDKVENSDPNRNVDRRAFDQGWQKPGDVSFYKRPGSVKTEATSRFIEKENYLRLGSINVAYYLPSNWCKSVKLQTVKVTVFMNDIATWSSIKQERGIDYPFARNISASLQLTF